jgi:hypothetical protein
MQGRVFSLTIIFALLDIFSMFADRLLLALTKHSGV